MKTALAAIGAVVVLAVIVNYKTTHLADNTRLAELPEIPKQSDDVSDIRSNFTDEYFHLHGGFDMVDVQYGMGQPNRVIKFAERGCPDEPALVAIYNSVAFVDGALALEYHNHRCQPDPRAYSLIGIHPLPGKWSRLVAYNKGEDTDRGAVNSR